jgi:hypothetical protein
MFGFKHLLSINSNTLQIFEGKISSKFFNSIRNYINPFATSGLCSSPNTCHTATVVTVLKNLVWNQRAINSE